MLKSKLFDKPEAKLHGVTIEIRISTELESPKITQVLLDFLQSYRPNTPPLAIVGDYDVDEWLNDFVLEFSLLKGFVPDAKTDGRIKLFIPFKKIKWGNTAAPRADGIGPDLSEHP
jgi:hypothetical protein